ncbi:hypothetical protein [Peribacillus sp. R9-11]|nr:hypothetical protein [Peribacillus sp. R9-11]WMX54293.1 hypothetical protein RE409_19755 [Peribacillus sp. R9-11]
MQNTKTEILEKVAELNEVLKVESIGLNVLVGKKTHRDCIAD